MRRTLLIPAAAVLAAGVALSLSACLPEPGPGPSPAPTTTSAAPAPSPSSGPAPTPTAGPMPPSTCTINQLLLSTGQAQGAAGSTIVPITVKNISQVPCEAGGYPGISFVGDGNGTEIGAPAERDATVAPQRVTLQPGGTATITVTVTEAGNIAGCTPTPVDGFRIYPPNNYGAIFLPTSGLSGCPQQNVDVLHTGPVVAG